MTTSFARELKRWRDVRRLSQLDLAGAAGVSQRHLSFLETGRANPSRDMVLQLTATLDLPLRTRNRMLGAAGFAPVYPERALVTDEMSEIRAVLERLVDAHEPFPTYVVDRLWNIQLANTASSALTAAVATESFRPELMDGNAMRLLLHPNGVREAVANWPTAARVLVDRLRREVDDHPDDDELAGLLEESLGHVGAPGAAESSRSRSEDLLVPIVFRTSDGGIVRFYTTIATIGAAHDVTLEELRIETLVPADDEAMRFLHAIAI